MGVKEFAHSIGGHLTIENTLHWCLNITLREDENRVRAPRPTIWRGLNTLELACSSIRKTSTGLQCGDELLDGISTILQKRQGFPFYSAR